VNADPAHPGTRLRVLAADEDQRALDETAEILHGLGHEVTALAIGVREAADLIAADEPDLSLVVVHDDHEHALALIDELNEYSSGPVIAVLTEGDSELVRQAAERGIAAFSETMEPAAIQSAIELAVQHHRELQALTDKVGELQGALERRAVIERAKGILMERHSIDDREAFELLRGHARSRNARVVDIARAVGDGHALLPGTGE
jgi:AmiR/NasT family two-component response regulator